MKMMRTLAVSLLAGLLAVMLPAPPGSAGDTKVLLEHPVIQEGGNRRGISSMPDTAETPPDNSSSNSLPYPSDSPSEDTTEGEKKGKVTLRAPKVESGGAVPAGNPAPTGGGSSDIPGGQQQDGWNARAAEAAEDFPSINSTPFPGSYLDREADPGEGKASERKRRLRTIPAR